MEIVYGGLIIGVGSYERRPAKLTLTFYSDIPESVRMDVLSQVSVRSPVHEGMEKLKHGLRPTRFDDLPDLYHSSLRTHASLGLLR